MSGIIKKARSGNKKAMMALYEEYKGVTASMAAVLTNNEAAADEVVHTLWDHIWKKLPEAGIQSKEEFAHMIKEETVRLSAKAILFRDPHAFEPSDPIDDETCAFLQDEAETPAEDGTENQEETEKVPEPWERPEALFSGNPEKGLVIYCDAVKRLHPAEAFVLSADFYGISCGIVAEIVSRTEDELPDFILGARKKLAYVLDDMKKNNYGINVPLFCEARDLLKRAAERKELRDELDTYCYATLERYAKKAPKWKNFILPGAALLFCLAVFAALAGFGVISFRAGQTTYADIKVRDYGTITIRLDEDSAPITCANFISLAEDGFYNGLTFHRAQSGFVLQGGDPSGDGTGGSENTIVGEFYANGYENSLSHTRGAVSMARSSDYNSASSQFFIMQEDYTGLDGYYACFGYVVSGMTVVDAIMADANPQDEMGMLAAEDQPVIDYIVIRRE